MAALHARFMARLMVAMALAASLAAAAGPSAPQEGVRVVVWDEQQPAQKKAYDNFLGNAIAEHLKKQPGLSVRAVRLDDPEQGLSEEVLDSCDVLACRTRHGWPTSRRECRSSIRSS